MLIYQNGTINLSMHLRLRNEVSFVPSLTIKLLDKLKCKEKLSQVGKLANISGLTVTLSLYMILCEEVMTSKV